MPIDTTSFWDTEDNNNPPLTDEMIAEAEARLGVKLPAALLDLLRVQNGGYTQGFAFPLNKKTAPADDHIPFFELFGIVTDDSIDTDGNIMDTLYLGEEDGLPPAQVLISGDGDWFITLDYSRRDVPTVRWIEAESGEELHLANSFEEFIAGLRPESEFPQAGS